jgi:5-methylcytosine-specific restriction endonuclease McrA
MPFRPPVHRPPGSQSQQQQRKRYDQLRDTQDWRRWYKTAAWQRIRSSQLALEPLCRLCRSKGKLTPATVCDHVERHNGNPDKFWRGKMQSLCTPCHSGEKQREENR